MQEKRKVVEQGSELLRQGVMPEPAIYLMAGCNGAGLTTLPGSSFGEV
jgi:hypothetical protein